MPPTTRNLHRGSRPGKVVVLVVAPPRPASRRRPLQDPPRVNRQASVRSAPPSSVRTATSRTWSRGWQTCSWLSLPAWQRYAPRTITTDGQQVCRLARVCCVCVRGVCVRVRAVGFAAVHTPISSYSNGRNMYNYAVHTWYITMHIFRLYTPQCSPFSIDVPAIVHTLPPPPPPHPFPSRN